MATFRELIDSYGLADFATAIGVPVNTAKQMRRRDSVASEYWRAWVADALQRRKAGITYEALAIAAAERRQDAPPPGQRPAA